MKHSSRLEAFSDAVFAFALTLLVVSLDVPSSYAELMNILRGFIPFAASFAIVTWIWYEHNKFFSRYHLEDPYTVFVNGVLLFLILLYVYPLKFMATMVFSRFGMGPGVEITISNQQLPGLMVAYSLGFVGLFGAFALLDAHAWRQRDALELNAADRLILRSSLGHHLISICIGLLSVAIALIAPARWSWLAGPFYFLMGPAHGWWGYRTGVRLERLRAGDRRIAGVAVTK